MEPKGNFEMGRGNKKRNGKEKRNREVKGNKGSIEEKKNRKEKGEEKEKWKTAVEKLGIDKDALRKLELFSTHLEKWNRVHKLTNYRGGEIWEQIFDSLYPFHHWKIEKGVAVDVGTGAGFPGLVVGLAYPNLNMELVEPLKKRYSFLTYIKTLTGAKNIQISPSRVEKITLPHPVDLITSRAVGNYQLLFNLTSHLRGDSTKYLFYKGKGTPPPPFPHLSLQRDKRVYYLTDGNGEFPKEGE